MKPKPDETRDAYLARAGEDGLFGTDASDAWDYGFQTTNDLVLWATDLSAFDQDPNDDLVFTKEVIYEGRFYQPKVGPFNITRKDIAHWLATYKQMTTAGYEVPMPKGHSFDPEMRRATVIGMFAKVVKGVQRLSIKMRFKTAEARDALRDASVSIFVPKQLETGVGTYQRPIAHIGFTDYPVIPKLEGFKPLAASAIIEQRTPEENDMAALTALAGQLEVEVAEETDDDAIQASIVTAFQKSRKETEMANVAVAAAKKETKQALVANKPPLALAAPVQKLVRDARTQKIVALVPERISRPVAEALTLAYCSDGALALAATPEADPFDQVIAALQQNETVKTTEGTSAQSLLLSKEGFEGGTSPIVAAAKKTAAAAAS